ncbi:hypothetical protein Bca52824_002985 [Brassica carinata]|uniref:Uncharacterized protein n=1 Tax=Brassica carinata TaxID=52824 RepID=A0A8X7WM81_BRACI|nr:hypothetical protein Bca52824_002985 [Brassica carinata]
MVSGAATLPKSYLGLGGSLNLKIGGLFLRTAETRSDMAVPLLRKVLLRKRSASALEASSAMDLWVGFGHAKTGEDNNAVQLGGDTHVCQSRRTSSSGTFFPTLLRDGVVLVNPF